VALDAGWPSPDAACFASGEIQLQLLDGATRARIAQQSGSCIVRVVGEVTPRVWRVAARGGFGCAVAPAPSGAPTLASISPRLNASGYEVPDYYRGQALWLHASANVTAEDVTLYGSGNFAVTESLGAGGHTYRRLALAREPYALLSSNTDGVHSFSVGRGPTILDSSIAFMGDDAVNIHNRIGVVLAVGPGAAVRVVDVGDVPSPDGGAAAPARAFAELAPGDTLRFAAPAGDAPRGAPAAVAAAAWVTDAAVLADARALAATLPASVNPAAVGVWAFTLAAAPPAGLARGDLVNFDAHSGAGALVANCSFSDAYDGVMRLSAGGATLRGNTWARTRAPLSITFDAGWLEGATAFTNISILDNVFIAIGSPPASSIEGVIQRGQGLGSLTVSGNTVLPAAV